MSSSMKHVRDKLLLRTVSTAYSFQYAWAVSLAHSQRKIYCQCNTEVHEKVLYVTMP